MAIPGVELLYVFAQGFCYVCGREAVEERVPDSFRGGVYEVIGAKVLSNNWVEVRYRSADGASRDLLFISGSSDNFTKRIKLSPMPNGLAVEIKRTPPVSLFITPQELRDLGGWDGPLVIYNGQREGRERVWRERPWTWHQLIDSAFFLALALVLFVARWK